MPEPRDIVQKLRWWLEKRFDGPFVDAGDSLEHGIQPENDGISCGIIASNTLAHNVLGVPLWTSSRKVYERAEWFNILCAAHTKYRVSYQLVELRVGHANNDVGGSNIIDRLG